MFRDRVIRGVGALAVVCSAGAAQAQSVPADLAATLRDVVGSRIEAAVILAGEHGISGGSLSQITGGTYGRKVDAKVSKVGTFGDVGDRKPIGNLPLRWQLRLQVSAGYLNAKNDFQAGLLEGDESDDKAYSAEGGGGIRLWFTDHFSVAPTIMGMYGHIENQYIPRSSFAQGNLQTLRDLGLIDWTADTWSVIPRVDARYRYEWGRTELTLRSDFTYYYTRAFRTSNPNLTAGGHSASWKNQVEVDVPIGLQLFGRELFTGGYFNRTEFYGDLETGLATDHMYKAHLRLVLDFLGELWKLKWIGGGGSYLWGSNFHSWSVGVEISFKF